MIEPERGRAYWSIELWVIRQEGRALNTLDFVVFIMKTSKNFR